MNASEARPEPVLVEYADRGEGFMLARTEVRREFRDGAAGLLQTVYGQPRVVDTGEHPVWGLRGVPLLSGSFWCYSLRGRGGPYGAAGTCQFVFADAAHWSPGELWGWCAARAVNGTYDPWWEPTAEPSPPPSLPISAATVADVLRGLATERTPIALALEPADAAQLIGALLDALPAPAAGRYAWTSCLLDVPGGTTPTVAARWPVDLREQAPQLADAVDSWLGGTDPANGTPPPLSPRRGEALNWWAKRIAEGRSLERPPTVQSVAAMLDHIADTELPLNGAQITTLLKKPEGRDRLVAEPSAVTDWALDDPEQAREQLMGGVVDPDLANLLLDALIAVSVKTGVDHLQVPPAGATTPGWPERLAELLRGRFTEVDDLAAALDQLMDAEAIWTEPAPLRRAGRWLRDLGLRPDAHPRYFPGFDTAIIKRFAATGRLTATERAQLVELGPAVVPHLVSMAGHAADRGKDAARLVLEVLTESGQEDRADEVVRPLTARVRKNGVGAYRSVIELAQPFGPAVRVATTRHALRALVSARAEKALDDAEVGQAVALLADAPDVEPEMQFLLWRARSLGARQTNRRVGRLRLVNAALVALVVVTVGALLWFVAGARGAGGPALTEGPIVATTERGAPGAGVDLNAPIGRPNGLGAGEPTVAPKPTAKSKTVRGQG